MQAGSPQVFRAGMAFLDWPLSNGSLNPEDWIGQADMRAEHGHRLLGMIVGLLSLCLLVWTWLREERAWLRMLARVLVLVVVLQGVLGGARVRFDALNTMAEHNLVAQSFAVVHACGAMIVLGILVALTLASSRHWIERQAGLCATGSRFHQALGTGRNTCDFSANSDGCNYAPRRCGTRHRAISYGPPREPVARLLEFRREHPLCPPRRRGDRHSRY